MFDGAAKLPPAVWRNAFRGHLCDHRFYEVTESTLADQFDSRYFLLQDRASGAYAVQPFFFVRQDLAAGLAPGARAWVERLRRRWPNLFYLRMLMVGSPAAEGRLDRRERWACLALRQALLGYARAARPSIILLKDFPAEYRPVLQDFCAHGFRRMPGLPGAQLRLNFSTFEDYLQTRLSKAYRKSLRRKFKALAQGPPLKMDVVTDLSPHLDEVLALHRQVYDRARLRFERLNRAYFLQLNDRMAERIRGFLWRREGRLIAFNLCLEHEGTLHDLEVGFDYRVALDLHLYFVTWRDVISWCLDRGLHTYQAGPLHYDPKFHLRLELLPQDIYARHRSRWLNPIMGLVMDLLGPVRHEPILKRFPNYLELFG